MVRTRVASSRVGRVAVPVFCLIPSLLFAQATGGIAGVVKDSSGGVMPGVSVEAASPALIEKARTVVTDSDGRFNIVDLRPGTYTVTFSLQGFRTVRRDGLELTSSFTATVNAEMAVGALEESVTVSGQTPTVDIQNVVQQRTLNRDVIDDVPVGSKTLVAMGVLIPGVVPTAQDVGGTGGTSSAQISIHNSRGSEEQLLMDGMSYHTGAGSGGAFSAVRANEASTQEVTYEVAGLSAESETAGIRTNIVPKEGGNLFTSYTNFRYGNNGMQSSNYSPALQARGLTSPDALGFIFNLTDGFGGPVRKDKLWFYTAFQALRVDTRVGGDFYNLTPGKPYYTPDKSRPALDNQNEGDGNFRFTWKMNQKNKLTVMHQLDWNLRNHWEQGGCGPLTSPEACYDDRVIPTYMSQAYWSATVTNRLLLEAGAILTKRNFVQQLPGQGKGASTEAPITAYSYTELSNGFTWGQWRTPVGANDSYQWNTRLAASYVTGSHAIKVGFTYLHAGNFNSYFLSANGVTLQLLNGAPRQVTEYATPYQFNETQNYDIGLFAQDQWTLHRFTVSLGGRFDALNNSDPAQGLTPSPNTPTRNFTFPAVDNVPNWKNWTPRLGVAYDLFGNGKTAVKASLGKYLNRPNMGIYTLLANPGNGTVLNVTRPWTDLNGDFVPQCDFTNYSTNGECGNVSNVNFGNPTVVTKFDPAMNTNRGYSWEGSGSVQHQLTQNLGVGAAYIRRWYGNLIVTQNTATPGSAYDNYCITVPTGPGLPGGGGNQVCGLSDITPALFGHTQNVIEINNNQTEVFDGIDLTFNLRLANHFTVAGGTSTGRVKQNLCGALMGHPDQVISTAGISGLSPYAAGTVIPQQTAFCDILPPFLTQLKILAVYPLPWWGIQTATTIQSIPGVQILGTTTATNAQIAPSLGRTLAAGPNGTVQNIEVVPAGTMYSDRLNQVDLRLSKIFNLGTGHRLQGFLDFYNIFNANPVLATNPSVLTAAAFPVPVTILQGRLGKVGVQLDW
jgi:hypothetical protein